MSLAAKERARLARLGMLDDEDDQRKPADNVGEKESNGNGSNTEEHLSTKDREEERLSKHWLGDHAPKDSGHNTPTRTTTTTIASKGLSPVKPVTVVRHSLSPKGSAEMAFLAGETEQEMIARRMKELKRDARLKEKKKQQQEEPTWKKKERERQAQAQAQAQAQSHAEHAPQQVHSQSNTTAPAAASSPARVSSEIRTIVSPARSSNENRPAISGSPARSSYGSPGSTTGASSGSPAAASTGSLTPVAGSSPAKRSGEKTAAQLKEEARLKARFLSVDDDEPQPKQDVIAWTVDQVCEWLGTIGLDDKLEETRTAFRSNDVSGKVLLSLTADDLPQLNVTSFGVKRSVLLGIEQLKGAQ